MHRFKRAVALATVTSAAALAACGSSDVSAGTYVKRVCTAIAPFAKNIVSRSSSLRAVTPSNPSQAKKLLHDFYAAAVADTEQALSRVKTAGTPNVKNGKTISEGTVSAFTQLRKAFSQAASQANALPTNDPRAFRSAAQATGGTVAPSVNSLRASLSRLDNTPALKAAEAKEPACKGLAA